nr:hypothetical protein Iba_chr14cCG12960 [Ipomoea batatas]
MLTKSSSNLDLSQFTYGSNLLEQRKRKVGQTHEKSTNEDNMGRFQEWLQMMPPSLLQPHQAEDVNADKAAPAADDLIILSEPQNAYAAVLATANKLPLPGVVANDASFSSSTPHQAEDVNADEAAPAADDLIILSEPQNAYAAVLATADKLLQRTIRVRLLFLSGILFCFES